MFAWWGRTVYRYRYIVIGVMVALCLGGGIYGMSLGQHVTQSGFYDEGSQSVHASVTADKTYGRDTSGHIIGIYTAPEGKTVDDPAFQKKILDNLAQVEKDHPDQILRSIGYFESPEVLKNMADADKQHAFMSIQLKGDNDDAILNNYNKNVGKDGKTVKEALNIPGRADAEQRRGQRARRRPGRPGPDRAPGVVDQVHRLRRRPRARAGVGPADRAPARRHARDRRQPARRGALHGGRGRCRVTYRAVVVEDEETAGAAHAAYLVRLDFEVVGVARSGRDAVRLLAQHPDVDLVLLDFKLPDTHGLQLLAHLRVAGVDADVIAVTSVREVEAVRQGRSRRGWSRT